MAEYARKGGIVISTGRVPSLAPGFLEAKTDTPRIRDLARALFEAPGARGHLVKDDTKLGETLHRFLQPDVTAPPEIGFVHRKLASRDSAYFLVNTTNQRVRGALEFRDGWPAESWDPFTGKTAELNPIDAMELDLAPYESRVIFCPPLPHANVFEGPRTVGGGPPLYSWT